MASTVPAGPSPRASKHPGRCPGLSRLAGGRTRLASVNVWQCLLVLAAGIAAGTINTVVGSGTLITFPVLLAVGLPPVTANVSNTVGLFPGSFVGAYGYRRELRGQFRRAVLLGSASVLGAIGGGVLLLQLPAGAFQAVVPVLIVLALALVVFGKPATAWLTARG